MSLLNGLCETASFAFARDHAILRTYHPGFNRLVMLRRCRLPGWEEVGGGPARRNSAGHAFKLDASLRRTRSRVMELALCNPWEHFVTLTLSPENGDRQDLKEFQRALSKWLNNLNYRRGCNIRYLLIPELHADGRTWHMHGLFMGIPAELLRPFSPDEHLPKRLLSLLREGREIYDWPLYASKFGWVTCEAIHSVDACAMYITKYITKGMTGESSRLNQKLYLCSHGLKRSEIVCRGALFQSFEPDFVNEYVASKTFTNVDDAVSLFCADNDLEVMPVGFLDIVGNLSGGAGNGSNFKEYHTGGVDTPVVEVVQAGDDSGNFIPSVGASCPSHSCGAQVYTAPGDTSHAVAGVLQRIWPNGLEVVHGQDAGNGQCAVSGRHGKRPL